MGMFNEANSITGNLTQVLFQGQKAMTDQAIQQVKVNQEMKTQMQQQQTTMATVAMMTGIGGKIDTMA